MQYVRGTENHLFDENGFLSTTHSFHSIDGVDYWNVGENLKQGFHGIRFETNTGTKPGTMFYTIRVVDKWGKEHIETLPYKCFDRNKDIPSWCTHSDEYPYWWYHQITWE